MELIQEGTWCDLFAAPGRVGWCRSTQDGKVIAAWLQPTPAGLQEAIHFIATPGHWLLYLRAAYSGGHILTVGQSQSTGEARYLVDSGTSASLGFCHGTDQVEVIPSVDGWFVYVVRQGHYDIYFVNYFGTHELRESRPTSAATGFLQCDDGAVRLADTFRDSVPGLVNPTTQGRFSVGQNAGPDPARIRITDGSRLAALYTGLAQNPKIAVEGPEPEIVWACSWTQAGSWVGRFSVAEIPWGNDTPQEKPEDIPFQIDPNGRIADVLPYLRVGAVEQNRILWIHKSSEEPDWGEWWDYDDTWIGHYEDASTGHRLPEGGLDGYYMAGPRVWSPRAIHTGLRIRYETTLIWRNGKVEQVPVEIKLAVGSGRHNGREILFRTSYDPRRPDPQNPRRKAGDLELNYWGPTGWVLHQVWKDNAEGVLELIREDFDKDWKPHQPLGPFVPPQRPAPTVPIDGVTPKPEPKPMSFIPVDRGDIHKALIWLAREVYTPNPEEDTPEEHPYRLVRHPLNLEGISAWICDNYVRYRQVVGHEAALHQIYRDIQAVLTPPPIPPPTPLEGRVTAKAGGFQIVND